MEIFGLATTKDAYSRKKENKKKKEKKLDIMNNTCCLRHLAQLPSTKKKHKYIYLSIFVFNFLQKHHVIS